MKKLYFTKRISMLLMATITAFTALADDHTFQFDGDQDLYGYERQSVIDGDDLTLVEEISFKDAGIDFNLTNEMDTGAAFALVNAGGTNAGIMVYSVFTPQLISPTKRIPRISLTVPGGSITGVRIYMSGSGLAALTLKFNNKEVDSKNDGNLYYWLWKNSEGSENVTIEWENTYYSRFIHSIEVTYTQNSGDKKDCGLEFSTSATEGFIGEEFTAPELSNPYDLPLEWSSSNEAVATVDSYGKVTFLAGGRTFISVSTPGNDEYAPGNARYELTVIPTAHSIVEMKEMAPERFDLVKVCFPMTVMFGNIAMAYVTDAEGNAACIEDTRYDSSTSTSLPTIYAVGDVIPEGWIATNNLLYGNMIWRGLPGDVTEKVEVVYPEVNEVSPEDADRVVILKEVTFTTSTPSDYTRAYGSTPDGTVYEFQDIYDLPTCPAGTYDVTCVVKYSQRDSTVYFYLAPIAFNKSATEGAAMMGDDAKAIRYYDLSGREISRLSKGIYVKVGGDTVEKIIVR